ncbi:MAG: type II toxin-antitoxin system VapC family toxin [Solirubrobacteraceae bacterium]|nr:type II toxin-antitoxin system VapC family toxin [Solirubrobacteraceae bacterium]
MLVVDTSAVLAALVGGASSSSVADRLAGDPDLHAPHLLDIEVLHALRGLVRANALSEDRAHDVRSDVAELTIVRYPHEPLADRIWALRHNLTAYDAAFVALAEALGAPLVTCDAKLAAAPGTTASMELLPGAS